MKFISSDILSEKFYGASNALLQFYLNFERYMPHKAACHLTKCDGINDVKLFPTVISRI